MTRLLRLTALLCACWLLFGVDVCRAQVGGGAGPMPRHFPHAPPSPPPSAAGPGRIRLTVDSGERGPLVLVPKNGGFLGQFVVWNDGAGPLTVSRVAMRGDEDDPRLPPRFNARFSDGGGGSSVIQPHSSKRITVTWIPDKAPKLRQALGHVVLTSNDEAAGEVAMGFVAAEDAPLGFVVEHALTWLLLLPLLGALAALVMQLTGYADDDRLRALMLGLSGLECVVAAMLYGGFNGAVTRLDGNDGFQFVEHGVLVHSLGIEYYVGVDGVSVSLVMLTALVGFAGVLASSDVGKDSAWGLRRYYGGFALLLAGVMGVFVSLDLALFACSWLALLVALASLALVGAPRHVALRVLVPFAASATCLVLAAMALHLRSDPTFLADGVRVEHSFAVPELMRVAYNAKHLTLLGCAWVKVVWALLFLAFATLIPVVPLHGWFRAVIDRAPPAVGAVVLGVVSNAGLYGVLRFCFGILPDGSRWAATTLVIVGVVTIAVGAVASLRQTDLLGFVATASVGQLGFCLVGLGGMTREGIAGALLQMVGHGTLGAASILAAGALRPEGSEALGTKRERGSQAVLATALGVALVGGCGLPGLPSFWGQLMSALGTFPEHRLLVTIAVLAVLLAGGFQVSSLRRLAGPIGDARLSDLESKDLVPVAPLLALTLALGVFPSSFFGLVQGGVSDTNQLVNPPGPDEIALVDVP